MAELIPLEERASELNKSHLRCRDLGHTWKHQAFVPHPERNNRWRRSLKCTSCRCERVDVVDHRGVTLYRQYTYPDGYALNGYGHEVRSRSTFRREVMIRAGVIQP